MRRKRILQRIVQATSTALSQVFTLEGCGGDMLRAAERLDLEGIVAKRKMTRGPDTHMMVPTPSGTRSGTRPIPRRRDAGSCSAGRDGDGHPSLRLSRSLS